MSSNNLYRELQQLRLRPGKDVEITSSFYGSVIHIKNQPSAVYGAYRGPFSVILSGADSSQPPEILITDLTYQESNGKAGEIKMFNYRVIKVPETKLPLNECDIYLHIYYDTESKSLTAEFYPASLDEDIPGIISGAMGDHMWTARLDTEEQKDEFIDFVQATWQ